MRAFQLAFLALLCTSVVPLKLRRKRRPQQKLLNGRLVSKVNCSISVEQDLTTCPTCSKKDRSKHFIIQLKPEWAPLGVDRFLELVDSGFFFEMYFFRLTPELVQFGADYKGRWGFQHIRDVALAKETSLSSRVPKKGQICFAKKTLGDGSASTERTSQFIYGALLACTNCIALTHFLSEGREERQRVPDRDWGGD
jgi:hypothetical protein